MRIRANRKRGNMLKFMAGKERSRTEGSVECTIEEERVRKDMINDKETSCYIGKHIGGNASEICNRNREVERRDEAGRRDID